MPFLTNKIYKTEAFVGMFQAALCGDWRDKTGRKNTASGWGCTADFITLGAHQYAFVCQHQVDDEKKRAVLLCNLTRLQ